MTVLVLALDTATPTVWAGVVELSLPNELAAAAASGEGAAEPLRCLAERSRTDRFGHAEHLMPLVRAALADAGRDLREVEAVVVGTGPGPYTGLRVGVATAAALGDALDVPVHGVPTHAAHARRAAGSAPSAAAAGADFLVVTDARRREVYVTAYDASGRRRVGPLVAAPADVGAELAAAGVAAGWMTGPGAGLLADVLAVPTAEGTGPLAAHLVAGAARALVTGVVPGPVEPNYLRRPDADEPAPPKPVLPGGENP